MKWKIGSCFRSVERLADQTVITNYQVINCGSQVSPVAAWPDGQNQIFPCEAAAVVSGYFVHFSKMTTWACLSYRKWTSHCGGYPALGKDKVILPGWLKDLKIFLFWVWTQLACWTACSRRILALAPQGTTGPSKAFGPWLSILDVQTKTHSVYYKYIRVDLYSFWVDDYLVNSNEDQSWTEWITHPSSLKSKTLRPKTSVMWFWLLWVMRGS